MANDFISAYTAQQIEDIFSNVTRNLTPENMLKWSSTGTVSGGGSATVRGYVYPEDYGAVGNGTTDDSTALSNTIAAAQSEKKSIMLTGTYLFSKSLNSYGVSWFGNGHGTLKFVGTASVGTAFIWGGTDVHIEGVIFDLTNNSRSTAMQGLRNKKHGAQRQFFIRNKVICRTIRSNGTGNIYGVWMEGQDWHDAYFMYNYFENCCYGVQVNNMINGGDVINNPDGTKVYNIFIDKNICVNCNIGINTPHNYCEHVYIRDNIAVSKDMPINIAHTGYFEVSGNHIESTSTTDSTLHIEDVSYGGRVYNNYIKESSTGNCINLLNKSGASKDTAIPIDTIDIYNNTLVGNGKDAGHYGIIITDNGTNLIRMRGNKIYDTSNAIVINSINTEILDTWIYNSKLVIGGQQNAIVRGMYCYNVNKIAEFRHPATLQDIYCVDCTPKLAPSSTSFHNINYYRNVQIQKTCAVETGTLFDVIELPALAFYNVRVKVIFGNQDSANAYADLMISFNGTDYKITTLSSYAYGSVNNSFSFAVVNNKLQIKNALNKSIASGKITVILEEASYINNKYTPSSIGFGADITNNTVTVTPTTDSSGGESGGSGGSGGSETTDADLDTITTGLTTETIKCGEMNSYAGRTDSSTNTKTTALTNYLDISSDIDRTKMYKVTVTKNGSSFSILSTNVYMYDSNKIYLGYAQQCQNANSISFPDDVAYVRIRFKASSGADMSSYTQVLKATLTETGTIDTSKYLYLINWKYGYISTDGVITEGSDKTTTSIITDYIDISALDKSSTYLMAPRIANFSCNMTVASFYTENKTFISRAQYLHSTACSIPSNAVYCVFRTQNEGGTEITHPEMFTATIKAQ